MKLSKKIATIFAVTAIVTTVLYIISSVIMTKYIYNGEMNRITDVSTDYISQFNIERARITSKIKGYAANIQQKGVSDITSNGNSIITQINNADGGDIDYKVLLSSDANEISSAASPNLNPETIKEYADVLAKEKTIIKNSPDSASGIIAGNSYPYLVSVSSIVVNNKVLGYIVGIQQINDSRIKAITAKVGNNIRIVSNVGSDGFFKQTENNPLDIKFKSQENELGAYYQLTTIEGDKIYYLEVSEPSLVTSKIKTNTIVFAVLFIVISIIINIMVFLIIEKLVVRRISAINNEINNIKKSKSMERRLKPDNGTDEIATLTSDINEMFHSLEDYNKRILSNEQKYSKLVDGLDNGYALFKVLKDKSGNIKDAFVVEVNSSLVEMFRTTKEKMTAGSFSTLIKENIKDKNIVAEILKCVGGGYKKSMKADVQLGVDRWAYLNVYPIEEDFFAIILTDISENRKYAEDMKHLANYDVLTNLQNRYSLLNYLESLKKRGQLFNIFFIDLDNFKTINDSLGHNTGDEVLCRTAQVLQSLGDEGVTVGRLGGDEFLVIVEGTNNRVKVKEFGDRIVQSLNQPFKLGNATYRIEASIGASLFPEDTDDIESVLKYADIAMYKSKKGGGNRVEIFSKSMFDAVIIESKIKEAIEREYLFVNFQPIYDMKKKKITGAESLVRWNKDGKILEADEFVPIAKKTGDIIEIDNLVLEETVKFCKFKQRDEGLIDFEVSMNVSYKFLKQQDIIEKIKKIITKYGINPRGLKFEITEDEIVNEAKFVKEKLYTLKELGIQIVLDDFGTGYSSFGYIKKLPIDTIKIDKELLTKVEKDRNPHVIISALIRLSHSLDLDIVAEGVESKEQYLLLEKLKCDSVQGFYICPPVSKNEFPAIIEI